MGAVVIIVLILALSASMAGGLVMWRARATSPASSSPETQLLTTAVLAYVAAHGNTPPQHALRAALEDALTTHQFTRSDTATRRDRLMLGGLPLSDVDHMAETELNALLDDLDASLPAGVVAHRVGDFVFTYHGLPWPATEEATGLWIVIGAPDPLQNPAPTSPISVGLADGTVSMVTSAGFTAALAKQNALRQTLGLPPLPDPATVMAGRPAVATPPGDGD